MMDKKVLTGLEMLEKIELLLVIAHKIMTCQKSVRGMREDKRESIARDLQEMSEEEEFLLS